MSKVYNIENQEKFNVAMIVGHVTSLINGTKHEKQVENWTFDVELTALAMMVYDRVNGKNHTNEEVCKVVDDILTNGFDHESARKMIIEKKANAEFLEDLEDYQDFWYGVECGSYYGLPTEESLSKCNKAMFHYADNLKYGFVHEAIEALGDEE